MGPKAGLESGERPGVSARARARARRREPATDVSGHRGRDHEMANGLLILVRSRPAYMQLTFPDLAPLRVGLVTELSR